MAFTKVATVAELPSGKSKQVTLNGRKLALFNIDGNYYAIDDCCPHRGASLAEGPVAGTEVVCPWHLARFDVKTGAHLSPPAKKGVDTFKVQVVGEEIQVDMG